MFLIRNLLLAVMAFGLLLQCTVLDVGGKTFLTGRPGQDASWELIFYDEFDGVSIDRNKWATGYWWDRDGSNNGSSDELEWYQPDDVLVSDGTLKLRAQKRKMTAWDGTVYNYTSGIITTGRETSDRSLPAKFLFQYGYAEIRCRVPGGQGLWPAFWLLPATHESRPEIDVLEILGHDSTENHMHYHYRRAGGRRGDEGHDWTGSDFSAGWHTFAVDWQPNIIIWYMDGIERWRFTKARHISHEPMYLIANLAVGGNWPGAPDASTPFPSYFEIDYIRVWAREKHASLSPTADAFVHDLDPFMSFGSEALQYDEASLAERTITPARLRLKANSLSHTGSPHELPVTFADQTTWEEHGVNYHVRPGDLPETLPDRIYEIPSDAALLQHESAEAASIS